MGACTGVYDLRGLLVPFVMMLKQMLNTSSNKYANKSLKESKYAKVTDRDDNIFYVK